MPGAGNRPTDELVIEAVRAHVARLGGPSWQPESIVIHVRGSPAPITLPVPPTGPRRPPPEDESAPPAYRHNPDYTSCHRNGVDHSFNAGQASVMRVLWEAWEDGTPALRHEAILERAESEAERLRDLFRHHPAWGTWVVSAGSGCYRLTD